MSNLCVPGKISSLRSYLVWVESLPKLSAEEEKTLTLRLKEHNDTEAARLLVLSHLRYVVMAARSYRSYGLSEEDLIQEGNIGLMKAVKRFDPSVGVRLVTYAIRWIKAEINQFIVNNLTLIKPRTKGQLKLFFHQSRLPKSKHINREEAEKISEDLNVPIKDIHTMNALLSQRDISLHGDDEQRSPEQFLASSEASPAMLLEANDQQALIAAMKVAFKDLDARAQDIIHSRWLADHDRKITLKALAEKHQVSLERIRQIEKEAMAKIKAALAQPS